MLAGTAVYGTVRTVVWEDGGREAPSYPILSYSKMNYNPISEKIWLSPALS